MLNPPITGIPDLDAYLYDIHINGTDSNSSGYSSNPTTGEITDADGNVVGYLYQFIHIKYGTNNVGGGFSDSPTNQYYYGIHNSSSSTESTNPADYTWYNVSGGFGVGRFLFYQVLGGRQIKFDVNTAAIDYKWLPAPTTAVSLDNIIPTKTITFNEIMDGTVKELQLADDAVTAAKLNVAAISGITGDLVANSVGETQITTDAVTSQKIKANAVVAGKIDADAISARELQTDSVVASKIKAGEVTASKINVANLAAIKADLGSITAGEIAIGSSPAISGSTMTGTGCHIYSNGNFVTGNSTTNMVFNGSQLYLNGFVDSVVTSPGAPIADLTTAVILNFTVTKAGRVAIFYSGNIGATTPSTALGCQVFVQIDVKNSGGTIISSFTLQSIGAPIANSNPVTYKLFRSPASYSQVLSLGVGTYTLVATRSSQSDAFNSLGNSVGITNVYFDYSTSAYQVLA